MSYETTADPIKIGYLMDFKLSDDFPQHYRDDLTIPFDTAVIDGYQELVDEGCLAIFDADGVNSHLVDRFGEE